MIFKWAHAEAIPRAAEAADARDERRRERDRADGRACEIGEHRLGSGRARDDLTLGIYRERHGALRDRSAGRGDELLTEDLDRGAGELTDGVDLITRERAPSI